MDSTRRAVIIGVNKYQDPRIPELKGAENDANELCRRLTGSGGFQVDHLLVGADAKCHAIRKAISDLLWKTDPCGLSLFYFSGHGLQDGRENAYLAPYDVAPDEPYICGIRMSELREMVLASKNKDSVLIVLDCCYSGSITEGKGAAAVDPQLDEWFAALQHESLGKGKIILASSGKDEKSHELCRNHEMEAGVPHEHGVFTYHILEGLDGRAATTEEVTVDDLRKYIDGQLKDDPQHQLSFFGAGMSQAGQIVIAKASQRREINEKLKLVASCLAKDVPAQVFRGAWVLGEIFQKCPTLQPAIDLRQETNRKLSHYRGQVTSWILNHTEQLADVYDWCSFFQSNPLTVEFITEQPALKRGVLANFCQVAMDKMSLAAFLEVLNAASQDAPTLQNTPRSEPPGMAAKAAGL